MTTIKKVEIKVVTTNVTTITLAIVVETSHVHHVKDTPVLLQVEVGIQTELSITHATEFQKMWTNHQK